MPTSLVSKGFTFSQGKLNLEVTLDKEIYYHGEKVAANVIVTNNSRKAVKNIKVFIYLCIYIYYIILYNIIYLIFNFYVSAFCGTTL